MFGLPQEGLHMIPKAILTCFLGLYAAQLIADFLDSFGEFYV